SRAHDSKSVPPSSPLVMDSRPREHASSPESKTSSPANGTSPQSHDVNATARIKPDSGESATSPSWPQKHTIASGETLATISAKYYGTTKYVSRILKANLSLSPRRMKIGQILTIPAPENAEASQPTSSAKPAADSTHSATPASPAKAVAAVT